MADPRAIVPVPLTKRLTQAVNYGLSGGWFTPEFPPAAQQPGTAGRRFDYLAGYNISTRPRRDSGIDFQTLRNFAYYYDILRLMIERRKDQIATFEWSITPTDEALDAGEDTDDLNERAAAATKFLKYPDGRQTWNTWLRAVLEDMLVLDAVAIWPVYKGRQLLRLEYIDPSTIKLILDESGRRPQPPYMQYQQVLHGVPTADFMQDELFYYISNPTSNSVYGRSKVEQILATITLGMKRENSQIAYFTDGNVPAALVGVPDSWPAQTIAQFQNAFDAMLQGDLAARRKLIFVPGEAAKNMKEFKSEESLLKTPFDEWIIRIICFNFGISPTPFVNQVNRATAYSAADEARDEGLGPTLMFLKDMMDDIIVKCLRLEGIEFTWEMEPETDLDVQSQIDDRQLKNGSRSIDELRQRDGLDPLGIGQMIYTSSGAIPISMFKDGTAPGLQPPPAPVVASPTDPKDKPPDSAKSKPNAKDTGKVKTDEGKPADSLEATKMEGRLGREGPFPSRTRFKKTARYYHTPVKRDRAAGPTTQGRLAKAALEARKADSERRLAKAQTPPR